MRRTIVLLMAVTLLAGLLAGMMAGPAGAQPENGEGIGFDHYLSYQIKSSPLFPRPEVLLFDQFEVAEYKVTKAVRLLNPAVKNYETLEPFHPELHYTGYRIRPIKPQQARFGTVEIWNQFHVDEPLIMEVIRSEMLLVPTYKYDELPEAEARDNGMGTHYKCYRGNFSNFERIRAFATDQFPEGDEYRVIRPKWLCTPAQKFVIDGDGPPRDRSENGEYLLEDHLVCYVVVPRPRIRPAPRHQVWIDNQFQFDPVTTVGEKELCVPSIKVHGMPPTLG